MSRDSGFRIQDSVLRLCASAVIFAATVLGADVRLVCNANPPGEQVTHYGFWERADGTNWTLIGTTPDATNGVKFQRPFGKYTWSATAFNAAGMSDYATPLEFELRDDGVVLKRPTAPVQLAAIIDPWTLFPGASAGTTLTNELVAFYKLDESSGDAADSWGGLTMTNVGTIPFNTSGGLLIGAATNDSSGTTRVFHRPKWLDGTITNMSAAGWVFRGGVASGSGQTNRIVVAAQYNTTGNNRAFWMETAHTVAVTNALRVTVSGDGSAAATWYTSNSLAYGQWHHVAFTFAAGTLKLYTNGTEVADAGLIKINSVPGTIYNASVSATMIATGYTAGSDTTPDPSHELGALDAVGIWNRALTAAEITELYNGGTGRQLP